MSLLYIMVHPKPSESQFNAAWAAAAAEKNYSVHNLVEHMLPDGSFDVAQEHDLLILHHHIVLAFPIWRYSPTWLLQKWFAEVLTAGFAYGSREALTDKELTCVISTGQPRISYTPEGKTGCTIQQLTMSIEKIADYCNINYHEPFIYYGTASASPGSIDESTHLAMQHVEVFSTRRTFKDL